MESIAMESIAMESIAMEWNGLGDDEDEKGDEDE